jgi:hypothetical protein
MSNEFESPEVMEMIKDVKFQEDRILGFAKELGIGVDGFDYLIHLNNQTTQELSDALRTMRYDYGVYPGMTLSPTRIVKLIVKVFYLLEKINGRPVSNDKESISPGHGQHAIE